MGLDVQSGWEQAAKTITGLAGTATGSVRTLLADLASQEQALSRVGAGGTGFDATSQANVEYFRGGGIPGEYDTRMGGVGRQWMDEAAQALNARGLQEGIAAEGVDRAKINSDLASQVGDLTASRTKYESDLREQLLGARGDEIKALQDEREYQAGLALKKVQIEQAQQKINLQYQEAKAKAVTTADKFKLDQWYKQQNLILSQARIGISQQQANISQQNANTSAAKAAASPSRRWQASFTVLEDGRDQARKHDRDRCLPQGDVEDPGEVPRCSRSRRDEPEGLRLDPGVRRCQGPGRARSLDPPVRRSHVPRDRLRRTDPEEHRLHPDPDQGVRLHDHLRRGRSPRTWLQKNPGFGLRCSHAR
jgi:hypothetical protein